MVVNSSHNFLYSWILFPCTIYHLVVSMNVFSIDINEQNTTHYLLQVGVVRLTFNIALSFQLSTRGIHFGSWSISIFMKFLEYSTSILKPWLLDFIILCWYLYLFTSCIYWKERNWCSNGKAIDWLSYFNILLGLSFVLTREK